MSRYDDYLDEVYDPISLVEAYGAARILREVDPIAYRVGESEWHDSECYEGNHEPDSDGTCEWCGESVADDDDEGDGS